MPFSYERARRELLKEQEELREQLKRLQTAEYENIGHSSHMAEDATEAFEQAVGVALRRQIAESLEQGERALDKLDNGVYGICENCGERIDPARLKAIPQTTLCLKCKTQMERKRRRGI